jgi:hypothetical protein
MGSLPSSRDHSLLIPSQRTANEELDLGWRVGLRQLSALLDEHGVAASDRGPVAEEGEEVLRTWIDAR